MGQAWEDVRPVFASIDPNGPLEAAILFKRTGALLSGWTQSPVPLDVVTVMAATLFGAIQTLVEAVGDATPESVSLETGLRRILVWKVGSRAALLLVAPKSVSDSAMRQMARRILSHREKPRSTVTDAGLRAIVTKT